MTFLEQLAQKYANNSRLMIISLSTDDSREEWLAKAPADRSNWKQYWATKHAKEILGNEYNVSAIPHFMLFGRDGKVIDIHAPSPSDKNIDKLFHDLF
jgi:thioredoxin family protein